MTLSPLNPSRLCSRRRGATVGLIAALLLFAASIANAAEPDAAPPPPPRNVAPKPIPFGESLTLRQCLVFTAKSVRDTQSDVDNQDWVVMYVENHCRVPVVHLQVQLILLDTAGQLYGTSFWVAGKGDVFFPGQHWEDTIPVPDPDKRVPRSWTLRILRAETPVSRSAKKPTPPGDTR